MKIKEIFIKKIHEIKMIDGSHFTRLENGIWAENKRWGACEPVIIPELHKELENMFQEHLGDN